MKEKILAYLQTNFHVTSRMEEADSGEWAGISDYCGGNMDDAYDMGNTDGKMYFIQRLINKIEAGEFND